MCNILKISRSTYYCYEEAVAKKDNINDVVVKIFNENQHVYGTRKLKVELAKRKYNVSRRRIARIMRSNGLVSAYTIKKYKPNKDKVNNEVKPNLLERHFNEKAPYEVVVSDLTYVRVGNDWNYIFHTDRGSEFKNYLIDDFLKEFQIRRSLSAKGCPYDNAVAEATYKIIKTEFTFNKKFSSLDELRRELQDYVQWYNNERIHSSLNYMTPINYRLFYTSS